MIKRIDFIAELKYRTAAESGRKTPASSGYRPQIKFPFSEMHTSGRQVFIGADEAFPGDTITAEIVIVSSQFFFRNVGIRNAL